MSDLTFRARRLTAAALAALAATWMPAAPAAARPPASVGSAQAAPVPGADLDDLLREIRRFNPELAATVLEADAAAARAAAAGSLEDPLFKLELQDLDRTRGSILPGRVGSIFYRIEQDFPLWGKRDLRHDVAAAGAMSARARERATGAELAARVKTAFAQYYQASEAMRITDEIDGLLRTISAAAQARYGQGIGGQAETLQTEVERTRVAIDRAALERDQATARGRLNGLLDRPAGAPLAPPTALRPLPEVTTLSLGELVDRMEAGNPELAGERSMRTAAEGERKLTDKAWYPDVTLGASVVDRGRNITGYEAMVGFRIPLQWGLKEASQREAVARSGAAEARIRATSAKLRSALEEAYQGLQATLRTEALLDRTLLPQTVAAYRSSLAGYQVGKGEFASLLEAERRLQQARLDLLRVRAEQQVMLAEIERIIGEEP